MLLLLLTILARRDELEIDRIMRNLILFYIIIANILSSFGAEEYNSNLSPKYWDLQKVYTDSLCTDSCSVILAAKGLYFNGLCVVEYNTIDGVRQCPHEYTENCYTMLSHDIFRSDEYEILGDTIRFWGKSYSLLKLNKDTLILKSAQAPYCVYCYTLSKDQQSSIKNIRTKEFKANIARFIKTANIFFWGEEGLRNTFTLYDNVLQKEMKIKVYFILYFYDERLEIFDYKMSKIKYYHDVLNEWKDLDDKSYKIYSEEIANCIHHFSFEKKDGISSIHFGEIDRKCILPIIFTVSP